MSPKITELDLSRSLLERWADVYGICKELPSLRRLVLELVARAPLLSRTHSLQSQPLP